MVGRLHLTKQPRKLIRFSQTDYLITWANGRAWKNCTSRIPVAGLIEKKMDKYNTRISTTYHNESKLNKTICIFHMYAREATRMNTSKHNA